MTVKEKLLGLLENNRGEYLSGESIAKQLQVTRAAVWKAINVLRKDGFIIDVHTKKGYALTSENDKLTQAGIMQHLHSNSPFIIDLHNNVTSTNTLMRDYTHQNEGFVIAANAQTEGKGRLGRNFQSPADSGVYFSILLKPTFPSEKSTFITTMAAVAVCKAIEELTMQTPKIKWVNDIFVNGKKVCGILTQASFSLENNGLEYAVLGIGINTYLPLGGFSSELADIAGAVLAKPEGNFKNRLLASVLNQFWLLYSEKNFDKISCDYKTYSLVIGKNITILRPNEQRDAVAIDIDNDCKLLVEYTNGQRELLSSNEISIRGEFN